MFLASLLNSTLVSDGFKQRTRRSTVPRIQTPTMRAGGVGCGYCSEIASRSDCKIELTASKPVAASREQRRTRPRLARCMLDQGPAANRQLRPLECISLACVVTPSGLCNEPNQHHHKLDTRTWLLLSSRTQASSQYRRLRESGKIHIKHSKGAGTPSAARHTPASPCDSAW